MPLEAWISGCIIETLNPKFPTNARAECTHLGCIAAWRPEVGKHICPCHGSEYDKTGAVLRGPAPRPLELAQVEVLPDGKIRFSEWEMEDFRKS